MQDKGCNLILTRWPSYVYDSPLTLTDYSRNLVILEPVYGINQKPLIIGNLNLDSGLLNLEKRLTQLKKAIDVLSQIDCKNIFLLRSFDYT